MKNIYIYFRSLWVNRIKPLKALRALKALAENKEDTEQVFHVINAMGGSSRKYLNMFKKSGCRIRKKKLMVSLFCGVY